MRISSKTYRTAQFLGQLSKQTNKQTNKSKTHSMSPTWSGWVSLERSENVFLNLDVYYSCHVIEERGREVWH